MTARHLALFVAIAIASLTSPVAIAASPNRRPSAQATTLESLQTWDGFVAGLGQAGERMKAKLPERLRNDPVAVQETYRLLLAATAHVAIEGLLDDPAHPVFTPDIGLALNIYQPNDDTVYRGAQLIDDKGTYRLRGKRGSVRIFVLGEVRDMTRAGHGDPALAYFDFDELKLDKDGRFDVVISPKRPEGYTGDWWKLAPGTERLFIRQMSYDWSKEVDPTLSIDRLDVSANKPQPSADALSARLAELPAMISNAASFFVDHVEQLRHDGYINKIRVFPQTGWAGLNGQFYYEGAYQLAPDEALVVEAKVPDKCRYWSIILTNDVYESTDWYNNQSSLNGSQARVDHDGIFRAVVSNRDPGVPNWLDTTGNRSGAVQGRWTFCSAQPVPTTRVVKIANLRSVLPADTPVVTTEQRAEIIRERRAQLQQRPLW